MKEMDLRKCDKRLPEKVRIQGCENIAIIKTGPEFIKPMICKPEDGAVLGGESDEDWAELADEEEWDIADYDIEGEVPDEGFEDDGYWPDEDPDECDESHDMH